MTERIEHIRHRLMATFAPQVCDIKDESALHAGHAGAKSGGGHFRLKIISSAFEKQSRINRHRLVYDCLDDMMKKDIHALAITALAPSEV